MMLCSYQLVGVKSMGSDITVTINVEHVDNWFVKIVRLLVNIYS